STWSLCGNPPATTSSNRAPHIFMCTPLLGCGPHNTGRAYCSHRHRVPSRSNIWSQMARSPKSESTAVFAMPSHHASLRHPIHFTPNATPLHKSLEFHTTPIEPQVKHSKANTVRPGRCSFRWHVLASSQACSAHAVASLHGVDTVWGRWSTRTVWWSRYTRAHAGGAVSKSDTAHAPSVDLSSCEPELEECTASPMNWVGPFR